MRVVFERLLEGPQPGHGEERRQVRKLAAACPAGFFSSLSVVERVIQRMKPPSVAVTIVTFQSERYIGRCLEAVLAQDYHPLEVVVVDNASTDNTRAILEDFDGRVRVIHNDANIGFAAGQNQAIAECDADWVLALNPDVLMQDGFIARLVEAGHANPRVGTVCGKLLRITPEFQPAPGAPIDSTGIYFTPALRHFDRGWQEVDNGRFRHREFVFGASAAAALYRRQMIEDVSQADGFFDPDFFAYREDADVAWRAQLLGWRCLYTPDALAYHVRRVVPGNRRAVPAVLNMHSVKNRFLMRIKNGTTDLYRRHWRAIMARDLMVIGGCFLYEPGSLPALWRLVRCLPRALAKRREIMSRRRTTDEYIASWFNADPVAFRVRVGKERPAVAVAPPGRGR